MRQLVWWKSSRSGAGNDNCVEVTVAGGDVGVRDSRRPDGDVLWFDAAAWARFVGWVADRPDTTDGRPAGAGAPTHAQPGTPRVTARAATRHRWASPAT